MGRRPKGGEAEGDEDPAAVVDQEGWKEQKAGNVTRSSTEGLRRPPGLEGFGWPECWPGRKAGGLHRAGLALVVTDGAEGHGVPAGSPVGHRDGDEAAPAPRLLSPRSASGTVLLLPLLDLLGSPLLLLLAAPPRCLVLGGGLVLLGPASPGSLHGLVGASEPSAAMAALGGVSGSGSVGVGGNLSGTGTVNRGTVGLLRDGSLDFTGSRFFAGTISSRSTVTLISGSGSTVTLVSGSTVSLRSGISGAGAGAIVVIFGGGTVGVVSCCRRTVSLVSSGGLAGAGGTVGLGDFTGTSLNRCGVTSLGLLPPPPPCLPGPSLTALAACALPGRPPGGSTVCCASSAGAVSHGTAAVAMALAVSGDTGHESRKACEGIV